MKRLFVVIGLATVIIGLLIGGMIMYKIHSENVFNEKINKIISNLDKENEDSESYKGTVYDKKENKFVKKYEEDLSWQI